MNKTHKYKSGKYQFKSYCKSVGNGFEVGFVCGSDVIFVGNFIHSLEATRWYRLMNREIKEFNRTFPVGSRFPFAWYCNFLKNTLYSCYYRYLERMFTKYNREFARAWKRDCRRYSLLKQNWEEKTPFFRKAA
jgi:hypothetical protein